METKELRKLERIYRHYVLAKVFGFKRAFLLFKQDTGFLILEIEAKVSSLVKRVTKDLYTRARSVDNGYH